MEIFVPLAVGVLMLFFVYRKTRDAPPTTPGRLAVYALAVLAAVAFMIGAVLFKLFP